MCRAEDDDKILDCILSCVKRMTAYEEWRGLVGSEICRRDKSETLLPSMNGFRVSRLLKFDDRFKETHVILITSNNVDSVQDMFRASGADHILGKPFRFRDLMESIEGVKAA